MATVKKLGLGDQQYGGFTPAGNVTTYRARLNTNATGAAIGADSAAALAEDDVVVLEKLPQGFLLEDAQVIVSTGMTTGVTGSLGFVYVDGVDDATVPQDDEYFGTGIALATAARLRTTSSKAPVRLAKEAYLVLTLGGADNAKASQIDVIVHGERFGPN